MKKSKLKYLIWGLLGMFASCKSNKDKLPEGFTENDTYFSMSDFFKDQWKNRDHLPYVMKEIVTIDNVTTDSIIHNWSDTFFNKITAPFIEADISDPKFIGKYNFYWLDDRLDEKTLVYEANDPDLFTQKLYLILDGENQKVKSVYVETLKDGIISSKRQNLLYVPDGVTQWVIIEKNGLKELNKKVVTFNTL